MAGSMEFAEGLVGEAEEETIAVVQTGGDEAVNKDGDGVGGEGGAESDSHHCVLAKKGFSSGRFYFQVEVRGQTGWEVGVVRESIQRKGPWIYLRPEQGVWTLGLYHGQYQANASPPAPFLLGQQPQKVGVSVDYEGGCVSFYDVDSRTLMYCFSGCCFNASRFSKLPYYYYNRTNILPFFRPSDRPGDGALTISPVHQR
ncbi:E3 ubiquitin-protein ligase TRIM21-like [Gadus macrocephalus]|uniref:E3 ubiquitin-protein ligase TRIM21-like n=1 Tax=Gadus macrocephalus TaxID=80720 RepID=UPI0028CB6B42|nr:E3 ubiquitin-protein ligase TRIM21-like [Gadus macrocephalus]